MNIPHKHAEFIKAWADGFEIEYNFDGTWFPLIAQNWEGKGKFRIKPERVWPESSMTGVALISAYNEIYHNQNSRLLCVANAAIKQYIIDTQGE